MNPPPGCVSVAEASKLLGIARQRTYQLIEVGRIPAVRKAGRVWVPMSAIADRLAGVEHLDSSHCIHADEVADFFGVTIRTVRKWTTLGLLPAHRIANRVCYAPVDVINFTPPTYNAAGRNPGKKATRTLRGRHYPPPGKEQPNGSQDRSGEP